MAKSSGKAKRRPANKVAERPQPRVPAKKDQLLVRTSERSSYNRCQWAWNWGYNERLSPQVESPPLRFGSLIHAALEERYPVGVKRGPKPAETFERLYAEELKQVERDWGFRDAEGDWAKALDLGVDMLEGYVDEYGKDEEWEVIASEMTFAVPVFATCPRCEGSGEPFDEPTKRKTCSRCNGSGQVYAFTYVGTMDGVWRNRMDGGVRINDYKTTSGDPTKEAQSKGVLDEQATAYWTWGVDWLRMKDILKPKDLDALDGMLYTFLYKAMRDQRPVDANGRSLNKDGTVSKTQPLPRFHRELVYRAEADRAHARQRAIDQVREMIARREGRLPIFKSPGTGYPDQQCKACAFFDMCELHEIGADWEGMRDATMTTWEPYGAHEIEEEGKY